MSESLIGPQARSHLSESLIGPYIPGHLYDPRDQCRVKSVVVVSCPYLPVAVVAPALDVSARQQGARVVASRGESDGACGERRTKGVGEVM